MKAVLNNINNTVSVDFEVKGAETPKELMARLFASEPKDSMLPFCDGEASYDEAKNNGSFDTGTSTFALMTKTGDCVPLDWEQPIQAQAEPHVKTLDPKDPVRFIVNIAKVVG